MIEIKRHLKDYPVIAAIRNGQQLKEALKSSSKIIFLLSADIFNIDTYVRRIRNENKISFIHVDFLEGIGKDKKAIEYLVKKVKPDGIISTRSNLIKYAQNMNLFTIQRFFIVDSQSLHTCIQTIDHIKPDMVEIMPGVMPKIINKISKTIHTPIIAGGLISEKNEVNELLKCGSIGISTGKSELWNLFAK